MPGAEASAVTVNVNLTLPAQAMSRYVTNSANEIVEVEGKTMITATAKSLDQILAARAANNPVPAITSMEKAAARLENLMPPMPRAPRRLPAELSPDIL
jgi:hypothetical protein